MVNRLSHCLMILAASAPLRAAVAQSSQPQSRKVVPPPTVLTPELRRAVVDSVAAHLERFYVFSDTGRLIAERLRARVRDGAYDSLPSPYVFAPALTRDMRSLNHDLHLSVGVTTPTLVSSPPGITTLPKGGPGGPRSLPAAVQDLALMRHNNLGRIEILPWNIGYFEITGFTGNQESYDQIAAALRYLETTQAVIIDVRNHTGGAGDLADFLASHFTTSDTVPVLDYISPGTGETRRIYTKAAVTGPRRPDVPLFILTSRNSVSAAETFAFILKNLHRAILVGDTTAGAGRNVMRFDTGLGFFTSVSMSTIKDPRTGAEWEHVGVAPDVRVSPDLALATAHELALRELAQRDTSSQRRTEYGLLAVFVRAQAHPVSVPAAKLQRYEGVYTAPGSKHFVEARGGNLFLRVSESDPGGLWIPLSDSEFGVQALRMVFEDLPGGRVRMKIIQSSGREEVLERSGPLPGARGPI